MTPLFRTRTSAKGKGNTILILDIENGSAASALLHVADHAQPRLFGESRTRTALPMRRDAHALSRDIERAVEEVLQKASELAARVRQHEATAHLGAVDSIVVFLAPPWGVPNLADGKPAFLPQMTDFVQRTSARMLGSAPVSFYTAAGAAAFGTRALMTKEPCLVCSVTGEVTELLRMDRDGVVGHATVPTGTHSYLRTLGTHGALTEAEARSAMRLPHNSGHLAEASRAAASEFATHFRDAAQELLAGELLNHIVIVAPEHTAERFARALTEEPSLADLFPDGGEVRTLRAHHATPHVAAHADSPDVHLLIGALFVDHHRPLS